MLHERAILLKFVGNKQLMGIRRQTKIERIFDLFNANPIGSLSLLLSILIAFFWVVNTPSYLDDFYYRLIFQNSKSLGDIPDSGDYNLPFYKIPYAIYCHSLMWNGRFANYAYLVAVPFPYWVVKIFLGVCISFFYFLLWKWAGSRLSSRLLAVVLPVLFWGGLPWHQHFQSSDFHFNYIIPSIMMVALLLIFRGSNRPKWWAWVLAFVFGAWHEGFTLVFGAFILCRALFMRQSKYYYLLLVLVLGFLVQLSPGTLNRIAESLEWNENNRDTNLVFSYIELWTSIVALYLWIVTRRKVSSKERNNMDSFGVGLIFSWMVSLIIILTLHAPQRAHWPNSLLSILFILLALRHYKNFYLSKWFATTFIVLYGLFGTSLVYCQHRVKLITHYCIDSIKEGDTFFEDRYDYSNFKVPFWLKRFMAVPYGMFYPEEQTWLGNFATNDSLPTFILLPKELKNVSFDNWPRINGNTDFKYIAPSTLVRRKDGENFKDRTFILTFGEPNLSSSLSRLFKYIFLIDSQPKNVPLKIYKTWEFTHGPDTLEFIYFYEPYGLWEGEVLEELNIVR